MAQHRLPKLRCLLASLCLVLSADAGNAVDFDREIRPILAENCLECHGPDAAHRKADLRLDTFAGATRDLGGYAAVTAGDPAKSELLARVTATSSEDRMPPPDSGKRLSQTQIEKLREWIRRGADYPTHWSFRPIEVPPVPDPVPGVEGESLTNIDRFIVSALNKRGLSLSPPATRRQLIRRVTFDLTGLPPTWDEVKAFVEDPAPTPAAFAKVVDRLLDSPAYGERWGRHWLDLARYADTHGASAIGFTRFPFSYTYRDYVIAAFNDDLPYDRFILEQIAADQLKLNPSDPALAALGFLTVGRQYRNRHDRIDDQIDVITRGLLGLTVSCARCHDHKFDPLPTRDYYSLHATLAASSPPPELPLVGEPEIPEAYAKELRRRQRLRDDIVREQGQVLRGRLRMQTGLYLRELAKGVPEQDTSTTFLSYRTEDIRPVVLERWRTYLRGFDENDPVFGTWHRLSKIEEEQFRERCLELVTNLTEENGDPKTFAEEHRLATKPPKWNPRILEALDAKKPASFVEVADVYGEVFANTHRRWSASLLEAAGEAAPEGELIPDQHVKHRVINSAIERQLRHHLYDPGSPTSLPLHDNFHLMMLNRGVRDSVRGTLGSIHSLNLGANAPPRSMILRENVDESRDAFVFLRGNPVNRGERVEPAFLSVLAGKNAAPFPEGERRLGLARAVVDPENPLTRRVIVNWVWRHHFGLGLVRTPDDFGTRGDPPTHPGLLDHLADALLEDGWSLKKLHRRILLTSVYRQGSGENREARIKDPMNDLLWRIPPRRLEMEAMRDALLTVTGELSPESKRGGPPFEEKGGRAIARRTVYAFVNRDVIPDLISTFDGADPSACTVKRPDTMVPQQTLFALNSGFIQDRAAVLAGLPEVKNAGTDEERVRVIYRRLYAREPDEGEIELAKRFLDDFPSRAEAWTPYVHALLAANEFHIID